MTSSSDARWAWDPWLRPAAALVVWHRARQPRAWSQLPEIEHGHIPTIGAALLWLRGGDPAAQPIDALRPSPAALVRLGGLPESITVGLPRWGAIRDELVELTDRWECWARLLGSVVTGHLIAGAESLDAPAPLISQRLEAIGYDPDNLAPDGGVGERLSGS